MPFTIAYVVPSTGATANYHEVSQLSLDKASATVQATVGSYLSADARAAGKMVMYSQQVRIAALPGATDAFAWAEQQLVAAAPVPIPTSDAPNRWIFAGGTQ
jgi:hypothetical protein